MKWPRHLGVRKGVRIFHKGYGLSQSVSLKEYGFVPPNAELVLGNQSISHCMLLRTSARAWSHNPCGHRTHAAEWKANFEGLTMEVYCWMFLETKYNKPKTYWLAHVHKTVTQMWSWRYLEGGIWKGRNTNLQDKFCIPVIPVGWKLTTFTYPIWSELTLGTCSLVQRVQIGSDGLESHRNYCSDSLHIIQVFAKVLRTKDFKQQCRQVHSWNI